MFLTLTHLHAVTCCEGMEKEGERKASSGSSTLALLYKRMTMMMMTRCWRDCVCLLTLSLSLVSLSSCSLLHVYTDRRTDNWPLMRSPLPTLNILAAYLLIVKYGPVCMKKRKAFDLRTPLVLYNFAVTALNAWMAHEVRWFHTDSLTH